MPMAIGVASAAAAIAANTVFFHEVILTVARWDIMASILFVRFDPDTPETHTSRDSTYSLHTVRMASA